MAAEIEKRRTRNSKTHLLEELPDGRKRYALDVTIGAIHYKDNPKDEAELWKDIDTTISANGKVRTAPYDLDVYLDGMPGFHYKSKESGEFDIRLRGARIPLQASDVVPVIPKPKIEGNKVIWENIYPNTDVILEAQNTRVSLKRVLKSVKAPLEYDIDIQEVETGIAKLLPLKPATDAKGQALVMGEETITGGRTEKLGLEVLPEEPVEPQPIAFPIEDSTEVDETIDAGNRDANEKDDGTGFNSTEDYVRWYGHTVASSRWNGGFCWATVDVPNGATIDTAYIGIYIPFDSIDDPYCDIYGNDVDDANEFATEADVTSRTLTEASVSWSATGIGTGWKNTPEIKTVIKEIVDRAGWVANNDMCILGVGKDDAGPQNLAIYSYDKNSSYGATLHIEYTEAAGGVPQQAMHLMRMRRT